ncbi:glutaminase [Saonia flava]|uniref:Glutaminase n=1 Tax=Saonia flava TaxID=523696 RepID=A0A846QUK2_9FLAO|nr:glutaminase A [Saonia flava]NJB72626.1 glutaminase [Saonia flava]
MITTTQIDNSAADSLFKMLDHGKKNTIESDKFLVQLARAGILLDDPRIQEVLNTFNLRGKEEKIFKAITQVDFNEILKQNALIKKSLTENLVIPDFESFCKEVEKMFLETLKNRKGNVADYIPQLARVNPNQFAISICTVDGQRFSLGDATVNFCLQSSCKPVNYCLALEELGGEKVHSHVGREPSGHSFNELTLNSRGLPHNPMINAGAIMSTSLIDRENNIADRFDKVSKTWQALCGEKQVNFNNSVYLSERQTADRNFALAYFMREKNAFPEKTNLTETLEFYFQCCSIESCTTNLSVAAATLANAGTNPLTGNMIFQPSTVQNCLSLMLSCGMYDFSGEFAFKIGLPAKSGVSGALMLVIPNVMGISIWSPRLDHLGNSVRGVEFCERLVERFSFHQYDSLIGHSNKINPRRKESELQASKVMELIRAASHGDMDEIFRLEAEGVSPNIADYDGRTPLHLAACEGQTDVVRHLVGMKVNLAPKDRWGNTPLDDAIKFKNKEIREILEQVITSQSKGNAKAQV